MDTQIKKYLPNKVKRRKARAEAKKTIKEDGIAKAVAKYLTLLEANLLKMP